MGNSRALLFFLIQFLIFNFLIPASVGQLSRSETRTIFRLRQLLEHPEVLKGWTNWTNLCYLPPSPSLVIVCSENRVTELTVVGNKTSPAHTPKPASGNFAVSRETLSEKFSINSLFTTVTRLANLRVLSLVSLGIWGQLPGKINRLRSLEVLNISSNYIYGEMPASIASLKNLTSLNFADNLFNGSVPDLGSLAVLEELDLSYNQLGGKFPTLGSNLVSVILRNNSLRSNVPKGLASFDRLRRLDISSNHFAGPIPSPLFSMSSIQYLNLAENQLTGVLPKNTSCTDELEFLDISHNLLIGKLPSCIELKSANRTVDFSWNCLTSGNSNYQHPYSFCNRGALAVKPIVEAEEQKSSIKLRSILGICGGILGAILVMGLLIFAIFRRAKAKKAESKESEGPSADKAFVHSSPRAIFNAGHVPRTMRSASLGFTPYHVFSLEEMEDVTNNFDPSNFMGEGPQGQIYKGWLRNGAMVSVRCLQLKQRHSPQSLLQYVAVISKLRHQNLVSVLGHCIVTYEDYPASTVFIVLQHISNGSLRDHLVDERKREVLKWPQRMAITIGVVRGIHFLHTGVAPGIFGNDLKIENVLLDENLTAKISNYNVPLPSKVGSESPLNGKAIANRLNGAENSEKKDVYQLGMILVEVITGRRITSEAELKDLKHQLENGLMEAPAVLRAAADSSIQGTFAYQSLRTTAEITINCLSEDPSKRPSLEDVLWNLQYSFQVQEGWTSSGSLSTRL
ncbi:probable LRR receptor-like serine/threonine-protein kinase At1g14390 [Malania oleifera]|uniref:probable LRR receptor-like serine/threonine-protein kinase At1g14390 n=1 Tax=Malania oleifera TaxID=397392 RepID=UPI0025ADA3B0|nr:probable LRR receptor-like serine/threonine-protein kinase At1g14390 [Malania oleifera]